MEGKETYINALKDNLASATMGCRQKILSEWEAVIFPQNSEVEKLLKYVYVHSMKE